MSILEAILLGFIQGITEFLPVSSSGHLVLVQKIMGISDLPLFFVIILHCGTLAAVVVALRRDVWNIIRRPFQRITALLILATAVTAGIAFAFQDRIDDMFSSGKWLGQAFLVTALALFFSDFRSRQPGSLRNDAEIDWLDAVLIGLFQGIALVPGVSRSGLTLSGALFRRLERDLAARFSFLLSIPAILGALLFQILDLYKMYHFPSVNPASSSGFLTGISPVALIAGTLSAALVGFAAVNIMLRIIRKRSLAGFGIYTALLGLMIILDQLVFHKVF